MDGRSAFVVDAAVRLIAAGGVYGKFTIEDAIEVVLRQFVVLDDMFEHEGRCDDPGCPECADDDDDERGTLQ